MRLIAAFAAAAVLAACSRKAPAPEPAPSRLEEVTRSLQASPACAKTIPLEWSSSWPVPSREAGAFRVFFYGRDGNPEKGFSFHGPEGDAVFTAQGAVSVCSRRGVSAPSAGPEPDRPGTLDEIAARGSKLYALTEAVAADYASGRDAGEAGRARAAEFSALFASLAHPGHAAAYRAANPDFWDWLVAHGGAAPRDQVAIKSAPRR